MVKLMDWATKSQYPLRVSSTYLGLKGLEFDSSRRRVDSDRLRIYPLAALALIGLVII